MQYLDTTHSRCDHYEFLFNLVLGGGGDRHRKARETFIVISAALGLLHRELVKGSKTFERRNVYSVIYIFIRKTCATFLV